MYKRLFYLTFLSFLTLPVATQAATVAETYQAASSVTDDGYILFVYGEQWDRVGESVCDKLLKSSEIQQAAASATLIKAPFYQMPTDEQKEKQSAVWGDLPQPRAMSAESYPALLLFAKDGRHYATINGKDVLEGNEQNLAAKIKELLVGLKKQNDLLTQAASATGIEKAKLLTQASLIPGVFRPDKVLDEVKALDPSDQSGCVFALSYHPAGWGEQHKATAYEAYLPEMQKHLQNPMLSPEAKQGLYAVAIGALHKQATYKDFATMRELAEKMKALAPDSQLGRAADSVVLYWAQPLTYEKGWSKKTFPPTKEPVELAGDLPIRVPGTYTISFIQERGRHALKIESVEAKIGNRSVSKDEHPGSAANPVENNEYVLNIPKVSPDLKVYVTFSNTSAESDSIGRVVITYGRPAKKKDNDREKR